LERFVGKLGRGFSHGCFRGVSRKLAAIGKTTDRNPRAKNYHAAAQPIVPADRLRRPLNSNVGRLIMPSTQWSMREFLLAGAAGVSLFALVIGSIEYSEFSEYKSSSSLKATEIKGVASFKRKSLVIREGDQVLMECLVSKCGYPGIYSASGKEITAQFNGYAISRVEIDSKVIDAFALELQRRIGHFKQMAYVFMASVAVFFFVLVVCKKAPNPSFQRTASGGR